MKMKKPLLTISVLALAVLVFAAGTVIKDSLTVGTAQGAASSIDIIPGAAGTAGIRYEGADDAHETTLVAAEATADRTVTLGNATGTVSLISYGHLYYDGDPENDGTMAETALVIATTDTYTLFAAMVEGPEAGDVDCEDGTDDCTVSAAGTYLLQAQMAFHPALASKDLQWALTKEGTPLPGCKTFRETAASAVGAAGITCIVALVANDSIAVYGMNATDAEDIDVTHLQLTVTRIGN